MYMVYWTELVDQLQTPTQALFSADDLRAALQFMEELRQRKRSGEPVSFIVLASENPDSVGQSGAADPAPDYKWMKRRKQ
jgi:hypothetical protein